MLPKELADSVVPEATALVGNVAAFLASLERGDQARYYTERMAAQYRSWMAVDAWGAGHADLWHLRTQGRFFFWFRHPMDKIGQ